MRLVDCDDLSVRQINETIHRAVADGEREVHLQRPGARHNLAVAVLHDVRIVIDGPVGYYCGGMSDGVRLEIHGSAGWGAAECLLSGSVVIDGNAGNGAAASIRGGTVVVKGDAAARAGIAMKGGLLVIGGDTGYMTGFMMQRGRIIVCGNAAVSRALPSFSVMEIIPVSAMAKFAPVMPTSAWRYFWRSTRRATIVSSSGSSDGAS